MSRHPAKIKVVHHSDKGRTIRSLLTSALALATMSAIG